MPSKSRKSRKTMRKNKGSRGHKKQSMTIPELRMGLHHISDISNKLCNTKMPHEKKVAAFQSEWHHVFGKKMDAKVASHYIRHMEKGKRTTRKMRGGGSLDGAPVDYMMRPGAPLPHGGYPQYVSKGFDVGVPLPGINASCGSQGGTVPYAGTGSNQVGGGNPVMDALGSMFGSVGTAASAISFRPYTATNPATTLMNVGTSWKGQSTGPGSESWQQAWSPRMSPGPNPVIPIAQALQRYLPVDVRQPPR